MNGVYLLAEPFPERDLPSLNRLQSALVVKVVVSLRRLLARLPLGGSRRFFGVRP